MSMDGDDIHLCSLVGYDNSESSSDESADDDLIEVVSNVDEEENNIIDMTKNLGFSSDDELQYNDDGGDHDSLFGDKNNCGFTRGALDNIRSSFNNTNEHGFTRSAVNKNLSSLDDDHSASDLDASDGDSFEYCPLNVSVPSSSSHSSSITTKTTFSTCINSIND